MTINPALSDGGCDRYIDQPLHPRSQVFSPCLAELLPLTRARHSFGSMDVPPGGAHSVRVHRTSAQATTTGFASMTSILLLGEIAPLISRVEVTLQLRPDIAASRPRREAVARRRRRRSRPQPASSPFTAELDGEGPRQQRDPHSCNRAVDAAVEGRLGHRLRSCGRQCCSIVNEQPARISGSELSLRR